MKGREGKGALFSHPEWNLPSGCGLFPRKGKRERKVERGGPERKGTAENFQRVEEGPEKTS